MKFEFSTLAGVGLIGAGAFMLYRMMSSASSPTASGDYAVRSDPFSSGGGGGLLSSLLGSSGGSTDYNPQSMFQSAAPAAPDPAPSSAAAPADVLDAPENYFVKYPRPERSGDE